MTQSNEKSKRNDLDKKFVNSVIWVLVAIVIFLIILVYVYVHQFSFQFSDKQEVFGAFGDYIGGLLNPLLAFSTVILLIFSIRYQIQELRNANEVMEGSTIALQQTQEIHQQNLVLQRNIAHMPMVFSRLNETSDQVAEIFNRVTSISPQDILEQPKEQLIKKTWLNLPTIRDINHYFPDDPHLNLFKHEQFGKPSCDTLDSLLYELIEKIEEMLDLFSVCDRLGVDFAVYGYFVTKLSEITRASFNASRITENSEILEKLSTLDIQMGYEYKTKH